MKKFKILEERRVVFEVIVEAESEAEADHKYSIGAIKPSKETEIESHWCDFNSEWEEVE